MKRVIIALLLLCFGLAANTIAEQCPPKDKECQKIRNYFGKEWPGEYFCFCPGENRCLQIEDWDMKNNKEIQSKIKQVAKIAPNMLFLHEKNPFGYKVVTFDIVYDITKKGKYILSEVTVWYENTDNQQVIISLDLTRKPDKERNCILIKQLPKLCTTKPDKHTHMMENKKTGEISSSYSEAAVMWVRASSKGVYFISMDTPKKPKDNISIISEIVTYLTSK